LGIHLEAFFHFRSAFSITHVLFLLLLIALDYGSLLELLPRFRCHFKQLCNARLLFGFLVHFTPLLLVESRLWQVSFPFNFISRSWLNGLAFGLLLFLHNMH